MIVSDEKSSQLAPFQLNGDVDPVETDEWRDSLEAILRAQGPERA